MKFHFRLIYLLLVGNVLLRFFTNSGLLPRVLNLWDVGITLAIGVVWLFSPSEQDVSVVRIRRRLLIFNVVLLAGALFNSRYFYFPAAMSQVIMLIEPILLFIAVVQLPVNLIHVVRFSAILRKLIVFELVFGMFQFPIYLYTGNSEAIVGTFYGNAEQYTGFLLLGVCYYLGQVEADASRKPTHKFLILMMLSLMPFVDNKASWVGVIVALFVLMTKLGALKGTRMKYILAFTALIIVGALAATVSSGTLSKFSGLSEAFETGNIANLGKVKAYQDILTAFEDNPYMAIIGAGPGTFYSRAAQQFYLINDDLYSNPRVSEWLRKLPTRTSNSMGGVIDPTSSVEPYYKRFFVEQKIFSVGTAQVDTPFSSYAGLLGETGIIGFIIYVSLYVHIYRRLCGYLARYRNDPNISALITASLGFLVYTATVSIYNPWLETGRMTTILWGAIAVICLYVERLQNGKNKATAAPDWSTSTASDRTKHRYRAPTTVPQS